MTGKSLPGSGPGSSYSRMLLRQHPWLSGLLQEGETLIAFSYREPETLPGISLLFVGVAALGDFALHPEAFGGMLPGAFVILAGALLSAGGVWAVCFAKRSYTLVTSRRILYQKINLLGRPGKTVCIPRGQVRSARYLKSMVMYRGAGSSGSVLLVLQNEQNGGRLLIPGMQDGENIFDALRER